MRFRASISNENVPTFFKIIQAVEKLQKKCIIKFTETNMYIICNHEANEGGIQVWSTIKVDSIFHDYRIQSNSNNEITMLLASEALLGALKSGTSTSATTSAFDAEEMVVKLAKKNDQAVLTFEIRGMTRIGHNLRVTHDVRIEVMRPADVEKLKEPMCPEPDVHILLPSLVKLRTVVEKLRVMSDFLALKVNNNKNLRLSIKTETVSVDVDWKGLQQPLPEGGVNEDRDPNEMRTVLISTRSFLKFLNSHVVSTSTIATICENHCVILYVYIGEVADAGGVLTYYIPAIIDDEGR